MLIVFSFVSAGVYAGATTVFQEIVALLIWIGSSTFWGIFIIAGMAGRRTTYIVYSESALNAERNIARLEKMYEQLNSQQLHALETSEREAISKIPPT